MISKQVFLQIITAIRDQEKIDKEVGEALEKICDSWILFNIKNNMYKALFILLKECFKDKDEWITWWLYEDVKKEVTFKNGKVKSLETPEQLYDFLIKNYN